MIGLNLHKFMLFIKITTSFESRRFRLVHKPRPKRKPNCRMWGAIRRNEWCFIFNNKEYVLTAEFHKQFKEDACRDSITKQTYNGLAVHLYARLWTSYACAITYKNWLSSQPSFERRAIISAHKIICREMRVGLLEALSDSDRPGRYTLSQMGVAENSS